MKIEEELVNIVILTLIESEDEDGYIAVDLDGTLAKYTGYKGATKIGEPIPAMVKRIRRWVGHGKKVKIFTARADDEKSVNAIKKWLKTNELPDLEVTNLKDQLMTELWDDRAVSVRKNTGEVKETLLAEMVDMPWGPNWQPQPEMVQWFASLLRMLTDKATWGAPGSQQVYEIDKQAKTFTLVSGNPDDPMHWHDKNKLTLAQLGYRVLDRPEPPPRPGEIAFAEAIVENLLGEASEHAGSSLRRLPADLQAAVRKYAKFDARMNGSAANMADIVAELDEEASTFDPANGLKNLSNLDDNERSAMISWLDTISSSRDGYPESMFVRPGRNVSPRRWGEQQGIIR